MTRRWRHDAYGCLRQRSDAARHDKRARIDDDIGHDRRCCCRCCCGRCHDRG
jgi:hypothetical protein